MRLILLSVARHDGRRIRALRRGLGAASLALALLAAAQVGWAWRLAAGIRPAPITAAASAPAPDAGAPAPGAGGRDLSPEARRVLAAKVAFLNRLLATDAVSWTGLLAELEEALPEGAYLTELRPERTAGQLRLAGVSPSSPEVSAFVSRLEARPVFGDVFLLQQAELGGAPASARAVVAFSVSLVYGGGR